MFKREQPLISIVIPSWFTKDQHGKYGQNETFWFAQECLKRLIQVTPKELYELIIINNGSTLELNYNEVHDGWFSTEEYWKAADILIRNDKNLGFAPACNQGFNLARGKYVACINNDILVWRGWEQELIKVLENNSLNPKPGVAMPALMKQTKDPHEALKIEKPDLTKNYDAIGPKAEFGSCYMIKGELLEQLKAKDGYYFDEQFLVGFKEDRDLWIRVRREGYETYRTHNTRVFHQGGMSMSKVKNRKYFTNNNRLKFNKKWGIKNKE